jgi:hypothetical protein
MYARECAVMADALTDVERRRLLELVAKLQQATLRTAEASPDRTARRAGPRRRS